MTRSARFRFAASLLLGSSLLCASLLADGAETPDPGRELAALLEGEIVPGGLTSAAAARRAVATSDELEARRSDDASAAAGVDQARGGYVPRVTLSAGYKRLSEVEPSAALPIDTGIEDNYETRAEAAIPVSDYLLRTPDLVASARHTAAATRAAGEAELHDVGLDARLAYYEWVRARLRLRVAEHALVQAEWHTSQAQKSAQAGSATRADVLSAESQQAEARLTLSRARDAEVLAREELRVRLHDGDEVTYAVGEDLLADVGEVPGFAQLWSEAQRRRPELRAAAAQTAAYREQADAQRAAWLPRVDVVGGVSYANPNPRDFPPEEVWSSSWDVGVRASWNLNELVGGRAGQQVIAHRASASRAREKVARDRVRVEVLRAHEAYRAAREEIVGSLASLAAASEAYRVRRAQYESGHATSVELIDAELALTRARFDAVNAHVDLRIALARIDHAVGR